jgi:hypothetical protein
LERKQYLDDRGFALDAYNTNFNKLISQYDTFRGVDESDRQRAQQVWENDFNSAGQLGYTADGTPTLQARAADLQAREADRDFNLRLLESLGYAATPGIAAGLELPEGMKTADQLFREQQLAGRGGGGRGGGGVPTEPAEDERNKLRYAELESLIMSGKYSQADVDEMLALAPAVGVNVGALKQWIDSMSDGGGGGGSQYGFPSWDRVAGLPKWAYLPNK